MNSTNYIFFEKYKRLEKLCNDMYGASNGITLYINNMKEFSFHNYRNIPNWDADLKQLVRLRHIRNNLAHNEGAFAESICTQYDIEWIQSFYTRILNQSDPLAMLHRLPKSKVQSNVPLTPRQTAHVPVTARKKVMLPVLITLSVSLFTLAVLALLSIYFLTQFIF